MKRATLALIRFYQRALSPYLGERCRFYPTCSVYAAEAVEAVGVWRGIGAAARRLVRCGPWAAGGLDPFVSAELSEHAAPKSECTPSL